MGEDELTPAQVRRLDAELNHFRSYRQLNRILEVGAGRGWFLDRAAKSGWETWAVEVNQDAIRQLSSKSVSEIIVQPAEEFHAPPEYFDAVRIWDVIEHLKSPRKAMTNIHNVLRTGGFLKLATTNFASLSRKVNGPEWVYLNGADHIVLFEPATITRLLSEIGFSNITIRTKSFNLRRKLYFPEQELPPSSTILRPFRKLIDEAMRFTLSGHQMLVTAVKA
jgi:ubiquinone/menaquinone biosynthesis C-methylase UbiE